MFRLAATVAVLLSSVLSAASSPPAGQLLPDDEKKAELKRVAGRWTRFYEIKDEQNKVLRWRMDLELIDGSLKTCVFDEKGVKHEAASARVIGVEKLGAITCLKLDQGKDTLGRQGVAEVYYSDLVTGGELVVIGYPNPWSFPPISGEYKRGEKLK